MADDAPSPARSAESPAPAADESNDATVVAKKDTLPAKDITSGGKGADEDVEMKSANGDDAEGGEEAKKDDEASVQTAKKGEEDHEATGAMEDDKETESAAVDEKPAVTAKPPAAKKSHKRKSEVGTKSAGRRKSTTNLKDIKTATPAKALSKKAAAMAVEYLAEDLVLHKMKGYAPWPAAILPDDVAELNPKLMGAKPGQSHKKGKSKPVADSEGTVVRQSYPVVYLDTFKQ